MTVFLWAYPLGLLTATLDFFPFSVENPFPTVGRFVVFVLFWGLAGIAFGYYAWRTAEKQFPESEQTGK